jgi:hypothetical protein
MIKTPTLRSICFVYFIQQNLWTATFVNVMQMLHNDTMSLRFDTARKLFCMEKELAQLRISSQRTGIQRYVRKRSELQAMSTCYLCLEGTQIGLAFLRATKHIREIQTS